MMMFGTIRHPINKSHLVYEEFHVLFLNRILFDDSGVSVLSMILIIVILLSYHLVEITLCPYGKSRSL